MTRPGASGVALVAFDFDGTLSGDEMIVLLGEQAGCAAEVQAITDRAMDGELTYAESLRQRVGLLAGLETEAVERALGSVRLRPGAGALLRSLARGDVRTAILTGGFEAGVEGALDRGEAAVDRVVANHLAVDGSRLTGEVEGPLVDGSKADAFRRLVADFGVDTSETVAVGDGANDVPMLDAAGTAVGFRPKPSVEPHCDVVVGTMARLRLAFEERGLL